MNAAVAPLFFEGGFAVKLSEKLTLTCADLTEHGPVTLAFFGDSVTHGYFVDDVPDYDAVYHARLTRMLHRDHPVVPINVINGGIGGTTAKASLARLERDVISHCPDLAVVCFGLNDVTGSIEDYAFAMDEIFRRLKEAAIPAALLTPCMLNTYVDERVRPDLAKYAHVTCECQVSGKMDRFMDAARDCARRHGAHICDCYAQWQALAAAGTDTTQLLCNLINHPARDMHQLFADALYDLIQRL